MSCLWFGYWKGRERFALSAQSPLLSYPASTCSLKEREQRLSQIRRETQKVTCACRKKPFNMIHELGEKPYCAWFLPH